MRANPQRFRFNKIFSAYFNAAERRLIVRSVIIGVLVWAVVFALKAAVNWSFYGIVQWVEAGPSLWLMLAPLAAGALAMAFFSHYHTSTVQYRDNEGNIQRLRDVDGDGLERAIALFYTSEPALNPKVDRPLRAGDMLLLLGEDHLLDQFAADAMEIT
jgi:phosphate/sulfate permease